MAKIKLGDRVTDRVTGFIGTATTMIEHLNGCKQIEITPKVDKEGKIQKAIWVDLQQVEKMKAEKPVKVEKKKTGGPMRIIG